MWAGLFDDKESEIWSATPSHFSRGPSLRPTASRMPLFKAGASLMWFFHLLQIKWPSHKAAHWWRLKTEKPTRVRLREVMNGPPAPPAATYPLAGEPHTGTRLLRLSGFGSHHKSESVIIFKSWFYQDDRAFIIWNTMWFWFSSAGLF